MINKLWTYNNKIIQSTDDFTNFKRNAINSKICSRDPANNGLHYMKTMLANLADGLLSVELEQLQHIHGRQIGNPISVIERGEMVCLDYWGAIKECGFISQVPDCRHVLEIGAGYGRTCHAIMSLGAVDTYTIVDLSPSIAIAQWYLPQVLTGAQYAKIRFVDAESAVSSRSHFDLAINIDSFAEMDAATVLCYMKYIEGHCEYFYTKNTVGKYEPDSEATESTQWAITTGLLTEIVDLYDSDDVERLSRRFIDVYRPGGNWTCLADSQAPPWPHYWQALYHRGGR